MDKRITLAENTHPEGYVSNLPLVFELMDKEIVGFVTRKVPGSGSAFVKVPNLTQPVCFRRYTEFIGTDFDSIQIGDRVKIKIIPTIGGPCTEYVKLFPKKEAKKRPPSNDHTP